MKYQPKRSSKRWLEGAPYEVLAIYDRPSFADRYTVLFGGYLWHEAMGRTVHALTIGKHASGSHEVDASYRPGKKIRWCDLPEYAQKMVHTFIKPDEPGHWIKTRDDLRHFETEFAALMFNASIKNKGEYIHVG
jgi:hypothetical protein